MSEVGRFSDNHVLVDPLPGKTGSQGQTDKMTRLTMRVHWAGGDGKISRSCRRGLFLLGHFLTLVLYPRRLDAQLDRLTEARGNEIGFRAFP